MRRYKIDLVIKPCSSWVDDVWREDAGEEGEGEDGGLSENVIGVLTWKGWMGKKGKLMGERRGDMIECPCTGKGTIQTNNSSEGGKTREDEGDGARGSISNEGGRRWRGMRPEEFGFKGVDSETIMGSKVK